MLHVQPGTLSRSRRENVFICIHLSTRETRFRGCMRPRVPRFPCNLAIRHRRKPKLMQHPTFGQFDADISELATVVSVTFHLRGTRTSHLVESSVSFFSVLLIKYLQNKSEVEKRAREDGESVGLYIHAPSLTNNRRSTVIFHLGDGVV